MQLCEVTDREDEPVVDSTAVRMAPDTSSRTSWPGQEPMVVLLVSGR